MERQAVIVMAMAKKITRWEAARIIGVCYRTTRQMRSILCGSKWTKPSACWRCTANVFGPERTALHDKLQEDYGLQLSYRWVKQTLQGQA